MEQPSKIIPSLPTQGSIKNVSEKETFSSRSPLTLKMQHTLNFVGRPQYGLIPQSRVPWLNFLTKLVFWVSENMNFSRWFGSLIPKSRSCHSVSEGVWRPQLALVNWPTGLTPAQCSRGVCVCGGGVSGALVALRDTQAVATVHTGSTPVLEPMKSSESHSFPTNAADVWHFLKEKKKSFPK